MRENDGSQFDRLPSTEELRAVSGRPTREAVLEYFEDRFEITESVFDHHTFWEKGAGRVWAFAGDLDPPQAVEALGLPILRTRQEHWKPTTVGVQRFGSQASRNVIVLDREDAAKFAAGADLEPDWDGDWGYLIAAHNIRGRRESIGIGLYTHGELTNMIPKGRRRSLPDTR